MSIPTLQQRYQTLTRLLSEKNAEIERLNKQIVTLKNHCLDAADLAWWKDDAKKLIGELANALELLIRSSKSNCPREYELTQSAREAIRQKR